MGLVIPLKVKVTPRHKVLKTPQIVFPALLDLDCPKGDVVRGGGSGGDSTLPNSASDSSGQEGPEDTHQAENRLFLLSFNFDALKIFLC